MFELLVDLVNQIEAQIDFNRSVTELSHLHSFMAQSDFMLCVCVCVWKEEKRERGVEFGSGRVL